jgi:hypothetical protein
MMEKLATFRLSRLAMEVATALATAVLGAVVALESRNYGMGWDEAGPEPGFFPFYVGLLIMTGSFGVLAQAIIQHRGQAETFATGAQLQRIAAFFLPILLFVAVSIWLGLYVGMFLYLGWVMLAQGRYRIWSALAIAVAVTVCSYLIFEIWFQVPLLKGPIEFWLKL